jgi:hypothetical protein
MRIFKTSPFGEEVDLDSPKTYKYLPKKERKLDDLMFSEIGKAICYMDFWHKDIFPKSSPQRKRINERIKYFTEHRMANYGNIRWFQEQVFLFQNETENMC